MFEMCSYAKLQFSLHENAYLFSLHENEPPSPSPLPSRTHIYDTQAFIHACAVIGENAGVRMWAGVDVCMYVICMYVCVRAWMCVCVCVCARAPACARAYMSVLCNDKIPADSLCCGQNSAWFREMHNTRFVCCTLYASPVAVVLSQNVPDKTPQAVAGAKSQALHFIFSCLVNTNICPFPRFVKPFFHCALHFLQMTVVVYVELNTTTQVVSVSPI